MTVGQDQFQAIMPFIVDDLTALIVQRQSLSEEEAVMLLYRSALYKLLEQEDTKLWQYSILTAFWLPGMLCFHDFKLFDHNSKMGVFP